MWTEGFILLIVALTPQAIIGIKQRNLETVYQWKQLVYGFPTEQDRQEALANGNLVPANGISIDVAPHQQFQKGSRVFITIPRFQTGIPYTLATVSDNNDANDPILKPYPQYSWHNAHGSDCSKITSAFRVAITECNQMFVIDSGVIGTTQHCPPQLLVFDLNTDTLMHRYRFEANTYVPVASLLITPLVVVHDPPPNGRCQRLHVYIADVTHHGLVIYDSESNSAWRAENKFMYPDPDYGTHTIARESFTLMDGMFAMSTDQRQLYFHPLASNSEYAVPLNVLNNRTNWDGNLEAMQNEFHLVGKRSSECAAEAMDSQRNLYCVTFNPIKLIRWNPHKPYNVKNEIEVPADPRLLEFVSGMKVYKNGSGKEELWMMSNRYQKIAAGSLSDREVNFRVVRRPLDDIQANYVPTPNQDLSQRLIFS